MLSERSKNMKTISLVTPCYNEEAGIRECYEAARSDGRRACRLRL